MKKLFFLSLIFLFTLPLSSLSETCQWTNIYNNDQVETEETQTKPGRDANGQVQHETCAEAVARRKQAVEKSHAFRNAGITIIGGSRHNCPWRSPLPPHTQETLTVQQIGEDQNGEPKYESCRDAQRRRQSQWIDNDFNGHKEDAEAAIANERLRLDQEATSANEKAKKAAEKQKKTGMIAIAGGMAAGVTAAACYSSCSSFSGGCCGAAPYFAALAAGLGIAGMFLGMAGNDNDQVAAQYQGGLIGDPAVGGGGAELSPTDGSLITPGGGMLPNPDMAFNDDQFEITLPNGQKVVPTAENFGPFLKDHGLKWDPKKKSITLPNGKSYTGEDTDNPELRQYAASGTASGLQNQLKGLEGQIAKAMGDDGSASDALGSGLEDEDDASLGGGGFAGYSGGSSGGGAGGAMAAHGRGPGSIGGGGNGDKASKVAGMSVNMGKNKVGVSQDNIFEMVHRRYQAKRKKQQFIELNL